MSDDNRPRNLLCGDGVGLSGIRVGEHSQLAMHLSLLGVNADLTERVERLESMTKKCGAEIENSDEARCLYSEVVRLYQEHEIVRPREVDSLLSRIKVLTEQK